MTILEYKRKYEQFYVENLRKVEFYAYNYLQNREIAKSAAHDSLLTSWEQKENVDFDKDVLPYLLRITKNKCLNILRREKARDNFNTYTAYRENLLNQEAIFHQSSSLLYEKELISLINQGLNSMPDKFKETFLLSKTRGLKNREIALEQGVSISTVKYRMSYVYTVLRKQLKDYLPLYLWFLLPIGLLYVREILK